MVTIWNNNNKLTLIPNVWVGITSLLNQQFKNPSRYRTLNSLHPHGKQKNLYFECLVKSAHNALDSRGRNGFTFQ